MVSSEAKIMLWIFRWPCLGGFLVLLLLSYPAPWGVVVLSSWPDWALVVVEAVLILEVLASFA
jgi:hypothetical protein